MRAALLSVVALVAVVGFVGSAASSDLSKFESRVGKSAPFEIDVTPPVVCLCREEGALQNHAGQLPSFLSLQPAYDVPRERTRTPLVNLPALFLSVSGRPGTRTRDDVLLLGPDRARL